MCEQVPVWVQYLTVGLALAPHVLTFVPPQYKGPVGLAFKMLNIIGANYGHCKNAPVTDKQNQAPVSDPLA
jgi:hypothetical protein